MGNIEWPLTAEQSTELNLILLSLESEVLGESAVQEHLTKFNLSAADILELGQFVWKESSEETAEVIGYNALIAEVETHLSRDFANVLKTRQFETNLANTMSLLLKNDPSWMAAEFSDLVDEFVEEYDDRLDDHEEVVSQIDLVALQEFADEMDDLVVTWHSGGGAARVAAQMPTLAAKEIDFLRSLQEKKS